MSKKNKKDKDWLASLLASSRELLASLPPQMQVALDNDAKFRDAVRSSERGQSDD